MFKKLHLYFAAVQVAAILAMITANWGSFMDLSLHDLEGLLSLVGIGILAEALAVNFVVGGNPATSSISFLPIFASIVLFPEPAGMLVAAAIMGGSEIFVRHREIYKVAFNTGQVVLAAGLGTAVYTILGGVPGISEPLNVPAFIGLALSFFLANQFLTSAFFAISRKTRFVETLGKVIGLANLLFDLLVSPIALIIVVLYREFAIVGVILVVLPLLVIRNSYVAKLQLEEANGSLLRVLIKAIETRDPYTSGHSIRVSTLAGWICGEMALSRASRRTVETAALLHDIGKIDVQYSSIIAKPSLLTPEERAIIQSHATRGADLLRKMTSLKEEIIRSVRHHHERFDGTGYPDGLRGLEIPLASRIIMLCDSIDAMLSDRPYRKALSAARVREELTRCSGSQFDPDIVSVVISGTVLERGRELTIVRPASAADILQESA